MNLYHYSGDMHSSLKTLRMQGNISDDELNQEHTASVRYGRVGSYFDHISFFVDPIPFDIMGEIYGKEHKVWHSRNRLVEYTVPVSALGSFKYEIVESAEKTELYYDDSNSLDEYLSKLKEIKLKLDYVGAGQAMFEKAIGPLIGKTRDAFIRVNKFANWDQIKDKYAANVPHVMSYPKVGIVAHSSAKWIKIK